LILRVPFFFGLGFVAIFAARSIWPPYGLNERERRLRILTAFLFPMLLLLVAWWADNWRTWAYFGICEAAFFVGGTAGWWFKGSDDGRDKGIFVGATALFLVFVALEYDVKLLDRVTKLGAGGVDIELTGQQSGSKSSVSQINVTTQISSAAFPLTDATDNALDMLGYIGANVILDEKYALALAGAKEGEIAHFAENMDAEKKAFANYACLRIEPYVRDLRILQNIHRSETATLAVDPKLVAYLRRAYYATQQESGNSYEFPGASREHHEREHHEMEVCFEGALPRNLAEAFCEAAVWTKDEIRAVQVQYNRAEKDIVVAPECGEMQQKQAPPVKILVDKDLKDSDFAAYMALVTGLSQTAVGNGESAIHLLDNQIQHQRDRVSSLKKAYDEAPRCKGDSDDACRDKKNKALRALSDALMTAIRLEVAENKLMQLRPSNALGPSELSRRYTTAADIETALSPSKASPSALEEKIKEMKEYCGWLSPDTSQKARATLIMQDLDQRNNALYLVGATRPEYGWEYGSDRDLIRWLDDSAEIISKFDFKCVQKVVGQDLRDPATARAYMLESVGAYWEAKARGFNKPTSDPGDETPFAGSLDLTAIEQLCKAKKAYKEALGLLQNPGTNLTRTNSESQEDRLGSEIGEALTTQYITGMVQGRDRVDFALSTYPAGERSKISDKHPECVDAPQELSGQTP
jgi:hypothetical protein